MDGVTGPVAVKLTEPVGVVGVADVSVTRALHKEAWLMTTEFSEHVTVVVVAWDATNVTSMFWVAGLLAAARWVESPA